MVCIDNFYLSVIEKIIEFKDEPVITVSLGYIGLLDKSGVYNNPYLIMKGLLFLNGIFSEISTRPEIPEKSVKVPDFEKSLLVNEFQPNQI